MPSTPQFPLPKKANLRADCAWVLFQILECGVSSRECLGKAQPRHSPRDRAWMQEMTMGTLRQLPQLQLWLRDLLNKPLKGNKKILEHLLLLGLYQLAFTRVSDHAAVGETVDAAKVLGGDSLKGLINGVLRTFQREGDDREVSDDPRVRSGLPKWIFKAIQAAYPDNANDVIDATNSVAPIWLRVNKRKISRDAYAQKLRDNDVAFSVSDFHTDGILLTQRTDVTSLPGFEEGEFAVQDGAAQLAAHYLAPQDGDRILDCCAAPGGKTGHIIESANVKTCIALDSDAYRLKRVHENMQRLGHSPTVMTGDASQPDSWWDGEQFDRILLDAPCSATGVIRRHPDIRWLRKSSDITELVALQAKILEALWATLKPGGTLLYATCSILPQENTQQIAAFLAHHDDASLLPLNNSETTSKPGRQILPAEQQMDGFYYARLLKSC